MDKPAKGGEQDNVPNTIMEFTSGSDALPAYDNVPANSDVRSVLLNIVAESNITLPIQKSPDAVISRIPALLTGTVPVRSQSPQAERELVHTYFEAITKKNSELVAMLIELGIVTPETRSVRGSTPLVTATKEGSVRMVQELVDFEADVNAFGTYEGCERTPLMVAAATGNLTLVKLFIDVFHADDALIAPDGALALRLAVENGHKEIVDFLPLRRGGGWKRWKTHHKKAVERAKRALRWIGYFFKIFGWELPKYLLWTAPKEGIYKPAKKACKWGWEHRAEFGPWCSKQVRKVPGKLMDLARGTKRFVTHSIPKTCEKIAKYIWSLFTKRIPEALKLLGNWLSKAARQTMHAVADVARRLASFIHTAVMAVITFFQNLTLKDVWNGFCDVLRAIFVDFPMKLWTWIKKFGKVSYKIFSAIAGTFGEVVWMLGVCLVAVVQFVPHKLLKIVGIFAGSGKKGLHEIAVWFNPKM